MPWRLSVSETSPEQIMASYTPAFELVTFPFPEPAMGVEACHKPLEPTLFSLPAAAELSLGTPEDFFTTPVSAKRPPPLLRQQSIRRYVSSDEEYSPLAKALFSNPVHDEETRASLNDEPEPRQQESSSTIPTEAERLNKEKVLQSLTASMLKDGADFSWDDETLYKATLDLSDLALKNPRQKRHHMKTLLRVSVYCILRYTESNFLYDLCQGCLIQAPGQLSHDCLFWDEEFKREKLREVCSQLCLVSVLNFITVVAYALNCLFINGSCVDQVQKLITDIEQAADPENALVRLLNFKSEQLSDRLRKNC